MVLAVLVQDDDARARARLPKAGRVKTLIVTVVALDKSTRPATEIVGVEIVADDVDTGVIVNNEFRADSTVHAEIQKVLVAAGFGVKVANPEFYERDPESIPDGEWETIKRRRAQGREDDGSYGY